MGVSELLTTGGERVVPVYSPAQIERRVQALARAISRDYQGRELVVVAVLKGAFIFAADLVRALRLPLQVDFVGLSSYGQGTASAGRVAVTKPLQLSIEGKDVLVVEDILDTGLSLTALVEYLRERGPRSIRICVLIDKRERRAESVETYYVGFRVAAGFIVGYGIDYAERYRALPGIYRVEFAPPPARAASPTPTSQREVTLGV